MHDKIIFIVGVAFAYSLIPQIVKTYKTKSVQDFSWQILIITMLGMYIMSTVFLSLKLYWSATIDYIVSVGWTLILIAKIKFRSNHG